MDAGGAPLRATRALGRTGAFRTVTGAFRTVGAATPSRPVRPGGPTLRRVTVTRPAPPLARPLGRLHQITAIIMVVFVVIAVVIVGAAAYRPIADSFALRAYADQTLDEIGAPASVCGEETTKNAEGSGEHVPETQQVTYDDAPPAFGPHWNNDTAPVPMDRKFVTPGDRPELEQLVHNSEHGFTIVWYDDTVADDSSALNELEAVAKKFPGSSNYRYKFLAVPWTSEDGADFPEGQHIAMTHWSIGGVGETDTSK